MSSYINCQIDTEPMAREIDRVSSHVEKTTVAVGAFKAAVIAAEAEGAEHVCQNVNRGFFSLMHSQISQKIAAKQSAVDSILIKLMAQKKLLLQKKNTMEREYERMKARYTRIFTNINKSLKQRVFELDQPVFDFAQRDVTCSTNRNNLLSATLPVCQVEGVTAAQQIASSNLKHDSMNVISAISSFMTTMNEQNALSQVILLQSVPAQRATDLLPVAVCESCVDNLGNAAYQVVIPEDFPADGASLMRSEAFARAETLPWGKLQPSKMVEQEFRNYINSSSASQRVKDLANKLFEQSDIKSF